MKKFIPCVLVVTFSLGLSSQARAVDGILEDDPLYDLIFAYKFLIQAKVEDSSSSSSDSSSSSSSSEDHHHQTTMTTTTNSRDAEALKAAQKYLINSYYFLMEQHDIEAAGAYLVAALTEIFNSDLIDFAALNNAIDSGEKISGNIGSSNVDVWYGVWLMYYTYLDAIALKNDPIFSGIPWALKHGISPELLGFK